MPVAAEAESLLAGLPQVVVADAPHDREHALEVELPFLQVALERFELVPLVVGEAEAEEVAAVLDRLWGGAETLIVVSTDLSHYRDYATAAALDRATADAIVALDVEGIAAGAACGRHPLRGLLLAARRRGLEVAELDLRSSGDTAGGGDRSARVVGYGAFALAELAPVREWRAALATIARQAVVAAARGELYAPPQELLLGRLAEPGASFVTLRSAGELRGCIGSIVARRALGEDVAQNSRAAVLADRRFEPVAEHELVQIEIELSLLTLPEPLSVGSRAELLEELVPGVDGLVLEEHVASRDLSAGGLGAAPRSCIVRRPARAQGRVAVPEAGRRHGGSSATAPSRSRSGPSRPGTQPARAERSVGILAPVHPTPSVAGRRGPRSRLSALSPTGLERRRDIDGTRAPRHRPGGGVPRGPGPGPWRSTFGVDVFFVLSGFLDRAGSCSPMLFRGGFDASYVRARPGWRRR